jgi:hypothetical protein
MLKSNKSFPRPTHFEDVYVRTAILATLAVALAYTLGLGVGYVAADIAAIWALISVKATFHTAIRQTVVQITATIVGGLISFLAIQSYGFSVWLMLGLVLFSFAIGYLLKLGIEGSTIIGFTIIVVTSNSLTLETTEARVGGVIMGTLIAAALSLFVTSGTPQSRARKRILELRESKHDLLVSLSEAVSEVPLNIERIFKLKVESKILLEEINKLVEETNDIIEASKWSPLTRRHEAEELMTIAGEVLLDAIVIVDMVESVDALRSDLPVGHAQNAKRSIARAARAIKDDYYDTETQIMYLVEEEGISKTQVLLTNNLLSSSERIKRRRRKQLLSLGNEEIQSTETVIVPTAHLRDKRFRKMAVRRNPRINKEER